MLPSSIALIFNHYVLLKKKHLIIGCIALLQLPINLTHAEGQIQQITYSENEQLQFSQLSILEGLSNTNVFGITQDHQISQK